MFVLIDIIYENDLVALGRKVCFKKGGDSHLGDNVRLRKKLNARERENNICLKKGADSHLSDSIRLRKKKLNTCGREKKIFGYIYRTRIFWRMII